MLEVAKVLFCPPPSPPYKIGTSYKLGLTFSLGGQSAWQSSNFCLYFKNSRKGLIFKGSNESLNSSIVFTPLSLLSSYHYHMIIKFIFGNKAKSFLAKYELNTSYYTGVIETSLWLPRWIYCCSNKVSCCLRAMWLMLIAPLKASWQTWIQYSLRLRIYWGFTMVTM